MNITKKEIKEEIMEQSFKTILEGVREIANDAGHEEEIKTIDDIVNYCMEDEDALEYVLA